MIIKSPIDLELTQSSGQTSQDPWMKLNDSYNDVALVDNKPVFFSVSQSNNYLSLEYNGDISNKQAILKTKEIFDLDFNLDKFYKYLNNYSELENVTNFCKDLRLFIAKDKFECIISSICSANNSIARWTKSIRDIKIKWGKKHSFHDNNFYTFPTPSILSEVYLDDLGEMDFLGIEEDSFKCKNNLKSCGVGYRAPYIKSASLMFALEMNLSEISKMSYDEAFETMLKVPGVGPKVADCILLYGFNFKNAFPADVWIKRIISYLYFDGKDISVSKVREFGMDEFGDYAGYVQLYLFHYARKSGLMNKLKK